MSFFKILAAATVVSGLMASGAMAADLMMSPPPVTDKAVSDWDGLYVGLTGGAWFEGNVYPSIGVRLGGNIVSGDLLFGAQGDLMYYLTSGNFAGEFAVRGGALLSDSALIYGKLGIGALSNGSTYVPIGAGVEFKLAEQMSLDLTGEYLAGNGFDATRVGASLNFHF